MFISRIVSPNPQKSPIFLTGNAGESRDWEIEVRCWPIGWQRKAHWYCQYKSPDLEYWEKEIPKSQSRLCCCCVRCAMLWLRWAHTSETAGFSLCIARGQQMGINSIGFGYTYNIGWSTESELLGDDSWLTCSRALFSICYVYFILFYFILYQSTSGRPLLCMVRFCLAGRSNIYAGYSFPSSRPTSV
jgi:hypothetical protein